jgi:hypothetical protein
MLVRLQPPPPLVDTSGVETLPQDLGSFLDLIDQSPNPGRIKRHDARSLEFPAKAATIVKSVIHTPPPEKWRLDQGHLGSCTGNAMAQWLNSKPAHRPRTRYLDQADAVRFYSYATSIDPWPGTYPPDDTGSSGIAVCKAAQREGLIAAYTWAFGLEHTLASLTLTPVMLGTVWKNDMFWPDAEGFVKATGSDVGGHEYLLFGINLRNRYVWALNSWSNLWGLKGRFKLSFETLKTLLDDGGDAVIPVL